MNPFYCYIFSFAVGLTIYSFNWSTRYPGLTGPLILFLLLTMAAHAGSGYYWNRFAAAWKKITLTEDRNPLKVTVFIYLLWGADFLYEGGIPLLKIIFGIPYNYRMFGIPSLHVFTVTFASFYTIYLFHLYLSTRNKYILGFYIINLSAGLLIYSRAMLIFNISSSLLLYLFLLKKIPVRLFFLMPLLALLLFYFFGVLGTLRVSRESKKAYDNQLFLDIGGASDSFKKSRIPKEFFWPYIYLSSPVANLQQNIKWTKKPPPVTVLRIIEMMNNEFLFDFISKRTNRIFQFNDLDHYTENYTVVGAFNVTTLYSRSFSYLGWLGMIIMAIFSLLIPWFYLRLLPPGSPYFLTGIAILCTIFLFMAYDNTIRFTGLGFQLIYPVLFPWLHRKEFLRLTTNS